MNLELTLKGATCHSNPTFSSEPHLNHLRTGELLMVSAESKWCDPVDVFPAWAKKKWPFSASHVVSPNCYVSKLVEMMINASSSPLKKYAKDIRDHHPSPTWTSSSSSDMLRCWPIPWFSGMTPSSKWTLVHLKPGGTSYMIHTYIHYIALHYIRLHYIALHCIALHYIALHCIALHYITLHYSTVQYSTVQYITLHCIALQYITLHYITLHYITLHTYIHIYIIYIYTYVYCPLKRAQVVYGTSVGRLTWTRCTLEIFHRCDVLPFLRSAAKLPASSQRGSRWWLLRQSWDGKPQDG